MCHTIPVDPWTHCSTEITSYYSTVVHGLLASEALSRNLRPSFFRILNIYFPQGIPAHRPHGAPPLRPAKGQEGRRCNERQRWWRGRQIVGESQATDEERVREIGENAGMLLNQTPS